MIASCWLGMELLKLGCARARVVQCRARDDGVSVMERARIDEGGCPYMISCDKHCRESLHGAFVVKPGIHCGSFFLTQSTRQALLGLKDFALHG